MSMGDIPMWEWLWMLFGSISAIVHFIVLLTIFQARQTNLGTFFKGPFFTIVLIQGVHELLEFLTVNVLNRARKYRWILYSIEEDNNIVEWEWYFYIFIKTVLYFGHLEIAFNRLSAFIFRKVGTYDKLWRPSTIFGFTLASYAVSTLFRAFTYSPLIKCTTSIYNGTDIFSFTIGNEIMTFDNAVDMSLSFTSAIVCAICYIFTAILARRYMVESNKAREIKLLKVGLATALILLPTPIRSGIELWGIYTGNDNLKAIVSKINMIPAEAMCVFQPWLLMLSCPALRDRLRLRRLDKNDNSERRSRTTTLQTITVTHS